MRTRGGVYVEVSPHPVLQVAMAETADALTDPPKVVGTLSKHDGSAAEVLESLAELHVRGVPVDWEAALAAHRPHRTALPTYPFQRQRHWLTAADDTGHHDRHRTHRRTRHRTHHRARRTHRRCGPGIGGGGPRARALRPRPSSARATRTRRAPVSRRGRPSPSRPWASTRRWRWPCATGSRRRPAYGSRPPSRSPTPPRNGSPATSSPLLGTGGARTGRSRTADTRAAGTARGSTVGRRTAEIHSDDDLYALIDRGYV